MIKMPPVDFDTILMAGGTDEVTPTISLKNGFTRNSTNFEVGVNGGYTRVAGDERFDGQTQPSSSDNVSQIVSIASYVNVPTVGQTITGSISGTTAVISLINGLKLNVTKIAVDDFVAGDIISVGATTIGTIDDISAGPDSAEEFAKMRNATADIYRADINAVPGSGSVLGLVGLSGVLYAWKNNVADTVCDIYKSSAAGWVQVPLYKSVTFTVGDVTTPSDGDTLTQGGVTATIKRVMLQSGEFSGSNATGILIIDAVAGGNFSAGAATIDTTTLTLSGAETQLTIAKGGRYEFTVGNFFGRLTTIRSYGCDGVNNAFEFDGDIYAPINTTAIPTHIIKHRDYLFVSEGATFIKSVAGEPYNFTIAEGASEDATSDVITGFLVAPGDTTNSTLIVYNRSDYGILYGKTSADFNFVQYNIGTGAVPYTVQNMVDAMAFDDRGVGTMKATLAYGNFVQDTITSHILPYINNHVGQATASIINRRKSQYRLFFNNGDALFCTIVNGKSEGNMAINMPHVAACSWEGKLPSGEDVSYIGCTDGCVYQLDKGTSWDGEQIEYQLTMNYSSAGSHRVLKRYRKAAVETTTATQSFIELSVGYALGYSSAEYEQPVYSSYTAALGGTFWDTFTWDEFFFDSQGTSPIEVRMSGTAENAALAFYGSSDYVEPFTVNSATIHFTPRRVMR